MGFTNFPSVGVTITNLVNRADGKLINPATVHNIMQWSNLPNFFFVLRIFDYLQDQLLLMTSFENFIFWKLWFLKYILYLFTSFQDMLAAAKAHMSARGEGFQERAVAKMALGTIHILRKHFYRTNLIWFQIHQNYFFVKTK